MNNKPVHQHPLVIRQRRKFLLSRPPHCLDVNTSSLKQLSSKLCMLMALTCPERSSIMTTLDIRYLRHYPRGVTSLHTRHQKRAGKHGKHQSTFNKLYYKPSLPVSFGETIYHTYSIHFERRVRNIISIIPAPVCGALL